MSSPMIVLLNLSILMLVLKPHRTDNVREPFGGQCYPFDGGHVSFGNKALP